MTTDRMRQLWLLAKILHQARRNLAWGVNTSREPWPEFTTAYTHNPIAYVDLALAQADAIFDWLTHHAHPRSLGAQTMTTLVIPLVGSHYYPPAKLLLEHLAGGTELVLDPEPTNPYDSNAVRVLLPSHELPEELDHLAFEQIFLNYGTSFEELQAGPNVMLGHLRRERDLQTTPGNISALALMSGCPEWTATLGFDLQGKPTVKLQTSGSKSTIL